MFRNELAIEYRHPATPAALRRGRPFVILQSATPMALAVGGRRGE